LNGMREFQSEEREKRKKKEEKTVVETPWHKQWHVPPHLDGDTLTLLTPWWKLSFRGQETLNTLLEDHEHLSPAHASQLFFKLYLYFKNIKLFLN
jgi:hypothetical protein